MKRLVIIFFVLTLLTGCANKAPSADSASITTQEDTPVVCSLSGTDSDGDFLNFRIKTKPAHGSLTGTEPNLVYTPEADFNGFDNFTFIANDGKKDSDAVAVSISVTPVNDPPAAGDDSITIREDIPIVTIDVLDNDTDVDGDRLIVLGVAHQGDNGSVTIITGNRLTYAPSKNFYGTDSFNYTISDGKGGTDTARVEIEVTAINDTPMITSKPLTTARIWQSYSYDVDATDPDKEDKLTYSLTAGPEGMTIEPTTGLIEWMPTREHVETHDITIKVADANDEPAFDTQSFALKVTSLDSPITTTLTVADGYNQRSGQALTADGQKDTVQVSDDKVFQASAGSYISFDFSDFSIPDGAKIASIVVFVEHFEDEGFPAGKLQWNIGTGWPNNPTVWASINAPVQQGERNKATDSWDITSIVETPENVDSLQLQIKNDSNGTGKKTSVDYIYAVVRWY